MSGGQACPQRVPGPSTAQDRCVLVPKQWQPSPSTHYPLAREQGFKNVMEAVGADHRC